MYSRGWPKSTAVGERMSKEGKDDDHKKSVLPPLPPGSGGGVGSGLVASGLSRLTNGGGEIRSPSHGGARARQAAQAQVAPQRPVPPIAVQGGVGGGGGGRIHDASEANGRGMGSTSGRTSQSPRRSNSTGWIQPPPSGHRQPSPRGSVASPSRGRPVLRTGSAGSRNSTSPHTSFHADSSRPDHNVVYPQPPSVQFGGATVRDASPRGRQPAPFSVERPLPVPLPKPPTPLARLHGEDEDDEEEYDASGRMTHVELFPGHSTPRWFADMLEEGLTIVKQPPDVTLQQAERVREECALQLVEAFDTRVATQRSWGGLSFDEKLQCKRWKPTNFELRRPFVGLSSAYEASMAEREKQGGGHRSSFEEAKAYLEENLFITHPFHRALLDLWVSKYSTLAFFRAMDKSIFPMDQEMFEQLQHAQCQYAREVLMQSWVSEVCAIFAQLPEHEWVPPHLHDKFLRSVRCLQAQNLGMTLKATADQIVGLFQEFAGTDDDAAMFIVNVTVSKDSQIVYMPDPMEALVQAKELMDLVRSSVCMLPVVPSSLARQPGYNNMLIMNTLLADLLLEEAKKHLDDMFKIQMEGPRELLQLYEQYHYVLSEPYYLFPTHWNVGSNWRKYHGQWLERWAWCDRIADEIELLTETEVDVGMFVAITSAPPSVGLVTEVLTEKVQSLGKHIKDTIADYISEQARKLLAEYGEIDALFKEDAKDNPKRLVVILDLLKGTDKRLKVMGVEAKRMKELFDALWDARHIFSDVDLGDLISCFYHGATMRDSLAAAHSRFRDTKWAVEEDLRGQRNELQSNLLDIMQKQISEVLTWDVKHKHAHYLSNLKGLASLLDERSEEGVAIIRLEEEFGWPSMPIQLLDDINRTISMHTLLWNSVAAIPKVIRMWQRMCASEVNPDRIVHSSAEWVRDLSVMMEHFGADTPAHKLAGEQLDAVEKITGLTPVLKVWSSPVLMEWHWKQIEEVIGQELIDPSVITLGQIESWELEKFQDELHSIEGAAMMEYRLQEALQSMEEQWRNYSLPIRSLGQSGTYYIVAVRDATAIIQDQVVKLDSVMSADTEDRYSESTGKWREKVLYMQQLLQVWWTTQRHFLRIRPIFASRDMSAHLSLESLLFERIDTLWRTTMSQVAISPSLAAVCEMGDLLGPLETLGQDLVVLNQSLNVYLEQMRQAMPRLYFPSEPELLDILASGQGNVRGINSHVSRLFPGVKELLLRDEDDAFYGAKGEMGEIIEIIPCVATRGTNGADVWLPLIEKYLKDAVRKGIDCARKMLESTERMEWMLANSEQAVRVASNIFYTDMVEAALLDENRAAMLQQLVPMKMGEIAQVVNNLGYHMDTTVDRHKHMSLCILDIAQRDSLIALLAQDPRNVHDFAWQCQLRSYWEVPRGAVDGVVRVEVMRRSFVYGNECVAAKSPLVWTDSLENCYKIMGTALSMQLGAIISGPAYSGRSAYVKELASFLGTFCVSVDCSLHPTLGVMDRLSRGLASSGGWVCFQEFSRVNDKAMATLSLALLSIQQAIRAKADTCMISGEDIKVFGTRGDTWGPPPCCFLTLLDQRHGEVVIPDTVRVLFRPIHLGTPDIKVIIEVLLTATGFNQPTVIARRLLFVYKLLREQLSHYSHYDFSTAALMMSLRVIMKLKLGSPDEPEMNLLYRALQQKGPAMSITDLPAFNDTLNDVFSSGGNDDLERVSSDDSVSSLRSKHRQAKEVEQGLLERISEECAVFGELTSVDWLAKVIGLYENLNSKVAVMLVGGPFSGKSECIRALAPFVAKEMRMERSVFNNRNVEVTSIFPKALSLTQLYGKWHQESMDWYDGVLPHHFRAIEEARNDGDSRLSEAMWWTVFDGPVDPLWTDGIGTVLGEDAQLQLPHGEFVQAPKHNKFIFQVMELVSAPPSLVSRCGVVYLPTDEQDWLNFSTIWLKDLDPRITGAHVQLLENSFARADVVLEGMIETIVGPTLAFIRKECREPVQYVSDVHKIRSLLKMFEVLSLDVIRTLETSASEGGGGKSQSGDAGKGSVMSGGMESQSGGMMMSSSKGGPGGGKKSSKEDGEVVRDFVHSDWVQPLFFFAIVWTVCAAIDNEGRTKVDAFLRDLCFTANTSLKAEKRNGKHTRCEMRLANLLPRFGSIYDFAYFDQSKSRSGWVGWSDLQPTLPQTTKIDDLVVPTFDFSRYSHLLDWLIASKLPIILAGPPACGKTYYFHRKLAHGLPVGKYAHVVAHLSSQTSSIQLQGIIETKLETKNRGVMGPSGDRSLMIQIEDLHLPQADKYGGKPVLELMRQVLDQKAWFSRTDPVLTQVEASTFCATMQEVRDAGRSPIPLRLMRHFAILHVCALSEADMSSIFGRTLNWYHQTNNFPDHICKLEPVIVSASIEVYHRVSVRLRPVPGSPQYMFSLRDLMTVLQGMCLQTAEDLDDFMDSPENEHTRLWAHEILRVFYDRIQNDDDRQWFLEMIKDVTKEHLMMDFNMLFAHLDQDGDANVDSEELRRLFFGHFMTAGVNTYDELTDCDAVLEELRHRVIKFEQWGQRSSFLSISLYQAEHITRLCRVLQLKRGHMLMIGSAGSGKRSMVRLSAFMSEMKVIEFVRDGSHGEPPDIMTHWKQFILNTISRCGQDNDGQGRYVLLLPGSVLTDEMFEDVNCLLNGVDIPGLFSHKQQVEIVSLMRAHLGVGDKSRSFSISELFSAFVQLAYNTLNIVICIDSQHGHLQSLCARFPDLVSRCNVNWLQEWPMETMKDIATQLLSGTQNTQLHDELLEIQGLENVYGTIAEDEEHHAHELAHSPRLTKAGALHSDLLKGLMGSIRKDKHESGEAASLLKKLKEQIARENSIRNICGRMHNIALEVNRQFMPTWGRNTVHICTTHFTFFVKSFRALLLQRRAQIEEEMAELVPTIAHVNKVMNRNKDEKTMRLGFEEELVEIGNDLRDLQVRVDERQEAIDKVLAVAEKQKGVIKTVEDSIAELQKNQQMELLRMGALWDQATQSLATVSARDLSKVKGVLNDISKTPEPVRLLMYALVSVLEGTRPEFGKDGKPLATDPLLKCREILQAADFKKRLIGVTKESETADEGTKVIKSLYASNPAFTSDKCEKAAAGSSKLFSWVAGVLLYYQKKREVIEPTSALIEEKKARLADEEMVLSSEMENVKEETGLMEVLDAEKNEILDAKRKIEQRRNNFEGETVRARKVFNMISGKEVDFWKEWNARLKMLQDRNNCLEEDCLITAASLTYLGALKKSGRELLTSRWKAAMEDEGLWATDGLEAADFLAGYRQLGTLTNEWEAIGLPTDDYTLLNVCIVNFGWTVPLIMDPHGFAGDFIRSYEASQGREVMVLTDDSEDPVGQIKYAVEQGIPLLYEGIVKTHIFGQLSHLLSRQTFQRHHRTFVHIGDTAVLYNEAFRFYITTRDEKPEFMPDVSMWITLVDFDLTTEGLNQALRCTLCRAKAPHVYWKMVEKLRTHLQKVDELEHHDLKPFFQEPERPGHSNSTTAAGSRRNSMYLDAGSGSGVSLRGADDSGKSLREHSAKRRGSTVGTGHRSKGSVARARAGSRRGSEILPRAGSHGSNTMMFGGDRDGPPMVDIVVHSLDQHRRDSLVENVGAGRSVLADDSAMQDFEVALEAWMVLRGECLNALRDYRKAYARVELLDALTRPLVDQYECIWGMRCLNDSYQTVYGGFVNLVLSDINTEKQQEGLDIKGEAEGQEHLNMMEMTQELFDEISSGYGNDEEDGGHVDEVGVGQDLEVLAQLVVRAVFYDLVRSIYEKHHLIFCFQVAVKRLLSREVLPPEEWQHFLTNGLLRVPYGAEVPHTRRVEISLGGDEIIWEGFGRHGRSKQSAAREASAAEGTGGDKAPFEWISDQQWEAAKRLSSLRSLTFVLRETICDSIVNNGILWEGFFTAENPVSSPHPAGIRARLSPFQELLLLRAFRSEFVLDGMRAVALLTYGVDANHIPPLRISAAFDDANNSTPILFLLGAGSDPTADIEAFASETGFSDKLNVVESTESTVHTIDSVIDQNMQLGHWVLVRNIHINADMMHRLEVICPKILESGADDNFRLWITCFPTRLSKMMYRQSMRMVWESPASLRGNLLQALTTDPLTDVNFFYISKNAKIYKKCLFALCFLHAAVKERALYHSLGWNTAPDVDGFDLRYCMVQMRDVIESFDSISVKSLRQLAQDLVYAGGISSDRDALTLEALSGTYFSDKLLNEGHTYTSDGLYYPPEGSEIHGYLSYVDSLPMRAPAGLFGLPATADHDRAWAHAESALQGLRDMQGSGFGVPTGELAGDEPWLRGDAVSKTAAQILGMLPVEFDLAEVQKAYPLTRSESRNRVLIQELSLHNELSNVVRNTLHWLMSCLKGDERMDVAMEELAKQIYHGQVPAEWMKKSFPSEKPLMSFIRLLESASTFFQKWVRAGTPTAFWLPAFFFPQQVASATAINYSRHVNIGIELVVLEHVVLAHEVPETVRVPISEGCYITGLSLVAAGWDPQSRILTCHENAPLCVPFPVLQMRPQSGTRINKFSQQGRPSPTHQQGGGSSRMLGRGRRSSVMVSPNTGDLNKLQDENKQIFKCPLYRTSTRCDSSRSNALAKNALVLEVDVPCAPPGGTKGAHLVFVKRGTALLIQSEGA